MRSFFTALVLIVCSSCAKTDTASGSPHATVLMRDGTTVAGGVVSTSPSEIIVAGDDKTSHTIAMKQVKSIEYDDPPPAAAAGDAPPPPAEAAHENHYHPAESVIHTKTYSLPVGTELSVRNEETIDSGKAAEGQTYAAEITRDVVDAAGDVVIPRGSNAQIVIRSASKGGRIRGSSDLVLDLKSVSVDGRKYALSTEDLAQRGKDGVGANKRTAEYSGGGAAIGAIIGAIAGGGKGAAIGAGSGAGAGALTQILTKGGSIRVPVETVLTFKLDRSLRVVAAQQ
jgi:outer membrane lipoprotein SlyB